MGDKSDRMYEELAQSMEENGHLKDAEQALIFLHSE